MSTDTRLRKELARLLILLNRVGPYHDEVRDFVREQWDCHPEYPELAATIILMMRGETPAA